MEMATLSMAELSEILDKKLDEKLLDFKKQIVKDVTDMVAQLIASKVTALEAKVTALENNQESQQKTIELLCGQLSEVKRHAVQNEQYSRRDNIRILGFPEEKGENCATKTFSWIREKLHSDIKPEDIAVAHRVQGGSPRGMIVRFNSRAVKDKVIMNRKTLKSSGMVVIEDLCRDMFGVLNRARNDTRVANAWSWNGKIFAKLKRGDQIICIRYGQSIDSLVK